MATVIANHRVKNYASWKPGYLGDAGRRQAAGITDIALGEVAGDPGMVYMVWEVADPSVLEPMMKDPELAKMMQEAGVISAPEMVVLQ